MKIKELREITFPNPGYDVWKTTAEASLKGKSVDSLTRYTYENIQLNPIYTEGNKAEELPGKFPFTRGISSLGYREQPWGIAQTLKETDYKDLLKELDEAVANGQNTISFDFSSLKDVQFSDFEELMRSLQERNLPLYLDLKGTQAYFCKLTDEAIKNQINLGFQGAAAEDIISEAVMAGQLPENEALFFHDWAGRIAEMDSMMPDLRSVLIKSSIYHNAGANAVQELAMAVSLGVEYLNRAEENGLSLETAASKMIFSFALDSNFFMGVAKLRAARRLWALIGDSYKADHDFFKMEIHAETSLFTQSYYDHHVNILRTANQAFAAVTGGIQYLEIHPFDSISEESKDLAKRIARNIHFILAEEAHLKYVTDPAAGSWYVESLTDQLTQAAWELFLEIEEQGGAFSALESGWIQERISNIFEEKSESALKRKERIIGTNVYADINERKKKGPAKRETSKMLIDLSKYGLKPVRALTSNRLASQLEEIRRAAEQIKDRRGNSIKVGLIGLNSLKSFKPRADFINGFFSAGGILSFQSKGIQSDHAEEALNFVSQNHDTQHFCICGSDEDYDNYAESLVKVIKQVDHVQKVYIAGKLPEALAQSLKHAGLDGMIHAGTSLEFINEVLQDMGSED
ncbi:methylmalonyl-CoA mutase family protein [Peribacillus deserti]|nr:methylmalonyl-CoA mutase family protein [Peribacillus deserti]